MKTHTKAELSAVSKVLAAASKKGEALNWREIEAKSGTKGRTVGILKALEKDGRARIVGKDKVGPVWWPLKMVKNPSPGVMMHGPHASADQRKAAKRAEEGARRWYQDPGLVTKARVLKGYKYPVEFVDIGDIVALAYRSDKFDGELRDYEHEFTKKRKLLMSLDGSTLIIHPPAQFTTQGIKG